MKNILTMGTLVPSTHHPATASESQPNNEGLFTYPMVILWNSLTHLTGTKSACPVHTGWGLITTTCRNA